MISEELCSRGVTCFGDGMLVVADTCPHFMCFGHVPGGIESLEVETHARPRDIETWIGPAVGYCFWVWVAKSEIETGFNSRGGGALSWIMLNKSGFWVSGMGEVFKDEKFQPCRQHGCKFQP
jgi:hypothetical protein